MLFWAVFTPTPSRAGTIFKGSVTMYNLVLEERGTWWTVQRRYSDFVALRDSLQVRFHPIATSHHC